MDGFEINPQRFGRYVLLDRIGVGGMAEVFRAVMPGAEGFQRTFVVKRILAERAQSPYFVDMFVQEARINALLHHPNIVQVFDFGNVGGTYFLAMEYVRGRDVSALLRRMRDRERPCPVGVATFIAHEVAQALGYAHTLTGPEGTPMNVVHRDVSPSNIICLRAGGVKLLDFGIAKAIGEPEVEKRGQGTFKGKLSYVAPERIKDLPIDGRSDLFSLGVVLWELLAGQRLFRGKNDFQTLKNVVEKPVPPPSSLRPDVPPELDRIVARALARDPAERYPNGQALAEDLDGVLAALRYQPRALPEFLTALFGGELASRQIPTGKLTAELLAACSADIPSGLVSSRAPSGVVPLAAIPGGAAGDTPLPYEVSISVAAPLPRRRTRWMSWAAASAGTVALAGLLLARGGGGRSQGATLPPAALTAPPVAEPVAPPPAPVAAAPAPHEDADARPASRTRRSDKGRIARGLSVDPFAEAASRVGR